MTPASLIWADETVRCQGTWTAHGMGAWSAQQISIPEPIPASLTIDGSGIEDMDTAGAWSLQRYAARFGSACQIQWLGFSSSHLALIHSVQVDIDINLPSVQGDTWLASIGRHVAAKWFMSVCFLNFLGQLLWCVVRTLRHPSSFAGKDCWVVVEQTGVGALALIALLAFLVGVVFAYQMGLYLQKYGAEIYIVPMSGLVMLREFGPLVTALIFAGRTGSAFAALMGVMKINQEIDALRTLGISPIQRLVIPRVVACLLVVPLLTFWADVFGIMGSMVVADVMLSVPAAEYLRYLRSYIDWTTYVLGLAKAPVFALIIVLVGCFQGLATQLRANSLGEQTTRSVVQSMFFIIVADALLSVLFKWQGAA